MNQLVFIENQQVVTDSLTIAEMFGKRHDHVIADIRKQINYAGQEFAVPNFREGSYLDKNNQSRPKFNLTEEAFTLVVFSYNTKEAVQTKIKFIQEFKRMREYIESQQQKVNFTMPGAEDHITLALEAALETRKQVQTIQSEVREVKAGIEELRDNLYITGLQAKTLRLKASQKVYEVLGGKDSNAFKRLKNRTYSACWREFWDYFGIGEYRELPRVKYEEGLRFLIAWQPKTELRLEIEHYNTQLTLKLIK